MKLFCTGLSGYVGHNLTRHIQEQGCAYINYDIKNGCDLLDKETMIRLMSNCDAVIHLAALPNISYCEKNIEEATNVNVYGTLNVANIAKELTAHVAVEKAQRNTWAIIIPVLALIVAALATIPLYLN